jgi:hypothetical protein
MPVRRLLAAAIFAHSKRLAGEYASGMCKNLNVRSIFKRLCASESVSVLCSTCPAG